MVDSFKQYVKKYFKAAFKLSDNNVKCYTSFEINTKFDYLILKFIRKNMNTLLRIFLASIGISMYFLV